jgi:peptidoglycan-binding protein ArfA
LPLPSSQPSLRQLAQLVLATTETVEIVGHTDNTGDDEINVPLSKNRAEAVADYLVSQGVPAGSVSADGAGSSQPVTSNATADGRAQNRRTEITVN